MARAASLKPRESKNPEWPWLVNIPGKFSSTGKRERRFFETKALAEVFAKQERIRIGNYGTSAISMPAGRAEEAANAFERLSPYKETLTEVIEDFIRRKEIERQSQKLAEVFKLYEQHKPKRRSEPYQRQLKYTLLRFDPLKDKKVASITRQEIENQLAGAPGSARNAFLRVLRAVFNFAIKREWAEVNPVIKIDMEDVQRNEIHVLTITQVEALLAASLKLDPELLPYHAIGLFAGVRPQELNRMDWSHIHLRDKEIKLPPEVTKTRNGRTINMEPVLVSWLNHHIKSKGNHDGEVVPKFNQRTRLREIRKKAKAIPWIQDGMRHSYASHWLKAFEDKDRLLGYMGHSTDEMLMNNYFRAVDRKTAAKYWKLAPPQKKKPPAPAPALPDKPLLDIDAPPPCT